MQKEFPPEASAELTDREREILKLLATGCSNKEIAQKLVISSNTVKVHIRNIFGKIGVASRTEAAMYAVRTGLVRHPASEDESEAAGEARNEEKLSRRGLPVWITITAISIVLILLSSGLFLLNRQQPTTIISTLAPTATPKPRWQVLSQLPGEGMVVEAVGFENYIYVIGRETKTGISDAVDRYNLQTKQWEELAGKPTPVTDVHAVIIGGKIYVPGGETAGGKRTNAMEIYNIRQNKWIAGENLPRSLSSYGLAAFEGRLYLFGGIDDNGKYLNTVFIYDPVQNRWTEGSLMPTARAYSGAAVAADQIFIMGGFNGEKALDANEAYQPELDGGEGAWKKLNPLPQSMDAMGIASIADMVYLLGGEGEKNTQPKPLVYVPQTDQWRSFDAPPVSLDNKLRLVSLGEFIYGMGMEDTSIELLLRYQAIYRIDLPAMP